MRTKLTFIVVAFFSCFMAKAQNDTMYVYKAGEIILQKAIADMDSITFAKGGAEKFDVYDYDGNGYHTVTIGSQTWMVENFRCTHYRTGVAIPHVPDSAQWKGLTTAGYAFYKNDPVTFGVPYGALYNWWAANDPNNLAPAGWHVAHYADFETLKNNFVATETETKSVVCGKAIKEAGTDHWDIDTGATNSTGWSAVGAGLKGDTGIDYGYINNFTAWWVSDPGVPEQGDKVLVPTMMDWDAGGLSNDYYSKFEGCSVRMVKDN